MGHGTSDAAVVTVIFAQSDKNLEHSQWNSSTNTSFRLLLKDVESFMVNTHPGEYKAGSLPQVSAAETLGDLGATRLGRRSEWLRRMKGRGP